MILFNRCRLLIKRTTVEDIQDSSRLAMLLTMFETKERQDANLAESYWGTTVLAGTSRRMITPLDIFGLCRIDKHLSLYWAPLTIELSLAPGDEAMVSGGTYQTAIYSLSDIQILSDTLTVSGEHLKLLSDHI